MDFLIKRAGKSLLLLSSVLLMSCGSGSDPGSSAGTNATESDSYLASQTETLPAADTGSSSDGNGATLSGNGSTPENETESSPNTETSPVSTTALYADPELYYAFDGDIASVTDAASTNDALDAWRYVEGRTPEKQSYAFDGSGSLEAAITPSTLSELTLSLYVYVEDLIEGDTVLLDSGTAQGNIRLYLQDNLNPVIKDREVNLLFEVAGSTPIQLATIYNRLGEHEWEFVTTNDHERKRNQLWMHLGVVYDPAASKAAFYIDGVLDSVHDIQNAPSPVIDNLAIGGTAADTNTFIGRLSDLKIFTRAFSTEEMEVLGDFRNDLWVVKSQHFWETTQELFVDSASGNDGNDGSEGTPLATLGEAVARVNAMSDLEAKGTHIVLKPGIYREGGIVLEKSGAFDKPIVIEAEPPGTVTVSGAVALTGEQWTQTGTAGVWQRYWGENFGRKSGAPSTIDPDTEARYRREILTVDGQLARPYPTFDYLVNSTAAETYLDDTYGFYVDEANDLIYLRTPTNPNNSAIEAGMEQQLLETSRDYVILRGIKFTNSASFERTVFLGGKRMLVEDCEFVDNGGFGLSTSGWGTDLVIRRSKFSNNGFAGLVVSRGFSSAYVEDSDVSQNQWRNDLGNYSGPDLSGFAKLMFENKIYLENVSITQHNQIGIWFDAQNWNTTLNHCYLAENDGALWFEINTLNQRLLNSALYRNRALGVMLAGEKIEVRNNVMAQAELEGAWGILSTLYYPKRTEQMIPDIYMAKYLTLEDNLMAITPNGSGKLVRFDNSDIIGSNAISADNIFYTPSTAASFYTPGPVDFDTWRTDFSDDGSEMVSVYPFTDDGSVTVGFLSSTAKAYEGERAVRIPVELSHAVDQEITVDVQVVSQSATEGSDFEIVGSTTLTFRPLERHKVINVRLADDDGTETRETFELSLTNAVNATIAGNDSITTTIYETHGNGTFLSLDKTAYTRHEAEYYDDHLGVELIDYVGFNRFRKYRWAMYEDLDFGDQGPTSMEISMAVPVGREGRTIEVHLDAADGPVIATMTTFATDSDPGNDERDWDVFGIHASPVTTSITGVHDVYIVNNYDYTNAAVVDWFAFKH